MSVPSASSVPCPARHAAEAGARFRDRTGEAPERIVFAPGRVNLIGEHTDYNEGFVLPMAIDRGIYLAARRRSDNMVMLWSDQFPDAPAEFRMDANPAPGHPAWSNYVRGVLHGMISAGISVPGFDAVIHSSLPAGGGVSSSAALEVATAEMCQELTGSRLQPIDVALLCQKAEHDFAGTPCGIMDQFAVVLGKPGHLLLLDCRSQEARHVRMPGGDVAILVFNTMVRHALNDGGYRSRRDDCFAAAAAMGASSLRDVTAGRLNEFRSTLPERLFRRARHVISENERTLAAVSALESGDWTTLGELMYASHESLRSDFEVSCAELDAVVAAASDLGRSGGVFGCRMTGGGFGGCCVAVVAAGQAEAIERAVLAKYREATGIDGAAFTTVPSGGPHTINLS